MSGERQDKKKGTFGRLFSLRSQDRPESLDQHKTGTGVAAQGSVTNSSRRPNSNAVPRVLLQSTSTPNIPEGPRENVRDRDDDDGRPGIPGGWPSANLNPRDGIYQSPSLATSWTDDLSASSQDTTVETEPQRPSQTHNRSPYRRKVMQSHEPAPLSRKGSSSSHSTRTRTLFESDNPAPRNPRTHAAESVEIDSIPTQRISPHDASPDNFPANEIEEDEELARVLEESRLEFEAIEQACKAEDQPNAASYPPVVGSYSQPVAGNDNLEEDEEFLRVLEESRQEALAVEESLREVSEALERSRLKAIRQSRQEALGKSRREAQAKENLRLETQVKEQKLQEEVEALERSRLEEIRQSRLNTLDRQRREAPERREIQAKEQLRQRARATERLRLEAEAKEKEQLRLEAEAKEKVCLEVEAKDQSSLETLKSPLVNPRFVSGPGDSPKAIDHFIPPRTNPRTLKAMLSPSDSQEADGRDPESSLLNSILRPSQINDFNFESASPWIGTTGHSQINVSVGVRSAPPLNLPMTTFVPPKDVLPSTRLHQESVEHASPSLFNPSTIGERSMVGSADNAGDSDHVASTIFSAPIMADEYSYPEFKSRYHASSDADLFPSITFSPPANIILGPSDLENTEATDLNASEQREAKQPDSSTDFHTTFAPEDNFSSSAFFPNTMESATHNYNLNHSNFVGSKIFQSPPREFDTTVSNPDDSKDLFIPPPASTLQFKLQNLRHLENTVGSGFDFSAIAASTSPPETHDNNETSSISENPLSFFVPPVNIFDQILGG